MKAFTWDGELVSAAADANSPAWAVRAAAGRQLAVAAQVPEVAGILHRLLLDDRDTAVVQETAEALLARRDMPGLRAVLKALSRAEEFDVVDQLAAEVDCDPRWLSGEPGGDEFIQQIRALAMDTDEGVRDEAQRLLARVSSTDV
ncbi:hypothetical protein ACFYMW_38890 [Streptomyces sp. NPDC006692]|uniref:hypothetical protein n=1 Tax=Streptomyces sp. NPDC006692 TaxID=3364758 RepID=UPI0036B652E7